MKIFKELAIAFSLANLCFLRAWSVFFSSYWYMDYPGHFKDSIELGSILIDFTLLALILFTGRMLVLRYPYPILRGIANACYIFLIILVMNQIRLELGISKEKLFESLGIGGFILISFVLFIGLITVIIRKKSHLFFELSRNALLLSSPFVLIIYYHAIHALMTDRGVFETKLASLLPQQNEKKQRVVWFIFDELDIRLAFENRSEGLELPELDRFKNRSLYATNAESAGPATIISVPAMTIGKRISKAEIEGDNDLLLTIADTQEKTYWSQLPNVFSKAKEMGFNSAVIGNYHPYMKILGKDVNYCLSTCNGKIDRLKNLVQTCLGQFIRYVGVGIPFIGSKFHFGVRQDCLLGHLKIREHAERALLNRDFNLVFVHWMIPHLPGLYDSKTQQMSSAQDLYYSDNLKLVDRTLTEIREKMEAEGLWENTTVIVTSDHWLREEVWTNQFFYPLSKHEKEIIVKKDFRVPFLIKFPFQQDNIMYEKNFNMVLIHDMILNILSEKISSPKELITWFDKVETLSSSTANKTL